jgi:manganese efflux pump family protein
VSILAIILIGIGLSMDALAVAITRGALLKKVRMRNALKVGTYFGVFQAVMPFIGWALGIKLSEYITEIDHWVALILLGFIGGKMIYESIKENGVGCEKVRVSEEKNPLNNRTLIVLAIATSIDALAVGVSFACLNESILKAITIIGITTFVICFTGVLIGKKCGDLLKNHAKLFGGIILVAIGVKIFIEHTAFGAFLYIFQ